MTLTVSRRLPTAPALGIEPLFSHGGEVTPAVEGISDISALYSAFSPVVFRSALRLLTDVDDAYDAVQDIFLKLYCQPTLYDPTRGRFAHWIMRVTRNYCLDVLRRRATIVHRTGQVHTQYEADDACLLSVEDEVWRIQRARALDGALTTVTMPHLHLLHLAYGRGLSHSAIARSTGLPLGTVKTRLRGTFQNLRMVLAQNAVFADSFAHSEKTGAPKDI